MTILPIDPVNELAFPIVSTTTFSEKRSEVECEVMGLFDQFRNPLLRYVISFGLSVQDGEEVVQEVFLSLFRHLQSRKSRRNLRAWLFRVAHNLSLKQRYAIQKSRDTMATDCAILERQLDPSPNPEEQVSFTQKQRRLLAVFSALSEEDQYCLRLRAEGLRYRAIAAALGISLGSVSISLTRSFARMIRADGS